MTNIVRGVLYDMKDGTPKYILRGFCIMLDAVIEVSRKAVMPLLGTYLLAQTGIIELVVGKIVFFGIILHFFFELLTRNKDYFLEMFNKPRRNYEY